MNNANTTPQDLRTIRYKFKFSEDNEQDFVIQMNSKTLDIVESPKDVYPEWAKLEYQQCSNCPLSSKEHEYCPIAKKLVGTIDFFCKPLEPADVELSVETPERIFSKNIDLKSAAVSLIGIYMATSDCPIMDKLRPMARHHLPLATTAETTYRSIANYLIAQYLLACRNQTPDWELKNLGDIYDAIKLVNTHFRERLLKISSEDCALSAILTLDAHAYYINLSLIGDTFYTIESLFDEDLQKQIITLDSPEISDSPSENANQYKYRFLFNNNYTKEFTFNIDSETQRLIPSQKDSKPSWTKLNCKKCPNCPLDENQHAYCPAAVAIAETIESLNEVLTIKDVHMTVYSAERNFEKKTTVADGLSSMMELAMISSGCPVLSRLKPLARNHLPFETAEEQVYRSLGMYLLYQKFSSKSKDQPDWGLTNFTKFYKEINTTNTSFGSRFEEIALDENSHQILTKLDYFTKYLDFSISERDIEELQQLFAKSYR